ncbi:MAG: NAD(P)/FAD-dependent oxidoreductase [Planctomycetota bacterium]|nr:NAD(P)/FAD-dependent oxidoreductase [Planctomycetota bacterium]
MKDRADAVVIGAGVVGLAVARRLAMAGRDVIVLERADRFGTEQSSRNSEIIHAGIYYPESSLKARFCVAGKRALYDYCAARGVPYQRVGKLIVATRDDEVADLRRLEEQALRNGVNDLAWMAPTDVATMEPAVFCVAALWSPSTGIVDSHALMAALLADAEAHGTAIAFRSPVRGGRVTGRGIELDVLGEEPLTLAAGVVVNAAGVTAQRLAAGIDGVPAQSIPPHHLCKGNYFTLAGDPPFTRLVYPVPGTAGLGVHATVDLAGRVRFGPDVEWVDAVDDLDVDPRRADAFYPVIRRYYPALADGALHPGYAGIRAKIQAPGEPRHDFVVQGPQDHGVDGLVNLFGIESPGLTAAPAIAEHVAALLGGG